MKNIFKYIISEEYMALGLRGFDLIIFAIIASYSQGGKGCYYGGLPFLAKQAGCHPITAQRIVKKLCDAGLLHKEQIVRDRGKFIAISLPDNFAKCYDGCKQNANTPISKKSRSQEATPYNKAHNENVTTDVVTHKGTSPAPQRFVKPSVDEVAQFCRERGNAVDAEAFVAFYESNGWKVGRNPMRDWRQAVITWEKRQHEQRKAQRRERKEESVFEHNMRVLDNLTGSNYHEQIYGQQIDEY